jgi:2-methylisocitrate lyase-like PEP mutase family enzyme
VEFQSMSEGERNRDLKARVASGKPILLPGVPNPLAARIAQDIGYKALYVTGAGVANTNLGVPDIGLSGLRDMVDAVRAIREVCDLPLVVDADTGFGNAVNTYHSVRSLEAAGANAIQLEDQVFPKKCGHFEGKAVVPVGEMVGKIKAAVDARRDNDLQIIARTDACSTEGFEAAMARAQAYIDAGADVTFVEAITTLEEIRAVPQRLKAPQVINIVFGGKTPALPLSELEALGYSFVLYANAALQASIAAMQEVLGALHTSGSLDAVGHRLAPFAERQRLVGKPEYDRLEALYKEQA